MQISCKNLTLNFIYYTYISNSRNAVQCAKYLEVFIDCWQEHIKLTMHMQSKYTATEFFCQKLKLCSAHIKGKMLLNICLTHCWVCFHWLGLLTLFRTFTKLKWFKEQQLFLFSTTTTTRVSNFLTYISYVRTQGEDLSKVLLAYMIAIKRGY